MNEESFYQRRRAEWQRLMDLCDMADRTVTDLKAQELKELVRLYRKVSTDLCLVRTVSTNPGLTAFLNDLAARSYSVIYRQPRRPLAKVLVDAAALSAQTVRRQRAFILASTILFFGSAVVMYFLCLHSPAVADLVAPPRVRQMFDPWKAGKFDERTGSQSAMMWAFYASNNPRVAMIAGSVGAATFGLLSLYLLLQNGAMLGQLASELAPLHKIDFLLSSISPHGVPELSGIIVSGACGMLLGYTIINPGRRRRGDALKAVGKDVIVLLATSIVLMFIAAPIEGFFSFNPHVPGWLKTTVAISSFAIWMTFWTGFGKTQEEQAATSRG